jgi:hypothetical protein
LDCTVFDRLVLASGVGEQLGGEASVGFGAGVDAHRHQPRERWVADLLSIADLFVVKGFVVVLGGEANCRMIGLEGLQDDSASGVRTTCATGDLSEELEGSFGRSKIWEGEALIGKRDADQGDCGDVVPFGDHLGAHQHVDLATTQPIEDRLDAIPRRGVAVEPSHPGFRETLFDGPLELFGTDPEPFVFGAPARSAGNSNGPLKVAVVAPKRALCPMLGQGHAARRALGDSAARRTAHARRKTTPVEKEDRLMAGLQALTDRGMKRSGKKRVAGRTLAVTAQVDDFDVGQRRTGGPCW